jgi:ubiquinone/menaquinone biosynthesis C-methylase UbiE
MPFMVRNKRSRDTVLKASRAYYAHRASYEDLLDQGASTRARIKLELDFLESIFQVHTTHQVKDVLDVACGNGRHVIGLARRGYNCTGSDYTPECVHVAKARAQHEHISLKLLEGDATKLAYDNEFDATVALYILFLLPDDEDVQKCLRQIHRSLKPGGMTVCNVFNPLPERNQTHMQAFHIEKTSAPGIRRIDIDAVKDYD